ncbi:AtpZ/AtpI family protein [Paremcibacter congregatus]|uniref:ATP synthase protein I n=1 Tax=Paremcibacter congregatus TaxID=2043170 RepID=A0A2G4YW17_9PROT|nr:AtpZ/AtpI family protein [Paremcibacter congregatus]PHZ85636.1 F0F1 ATP synthase subunit I [Paremcibacter congregatus]QDE26596.1 F0F1 ATP synthase subunit I [Paremcibacter congregatus]|tara:strand:- start:7364 stop:7720 length:357 start_codon:yes stop_codon:yes gene_type:complete
MEDRDSSSEKEPSSESLRARVRDARKAAQPKASDGVNESHAYGIAMRLVAELVSGLLVGFAIGWFLDKWFGTKPWMLIGFIFIGLGAGIFNVMRAARQIEAREARQRSEADQANSKEG